MFDSVYRGKKIIVTGNSGFKGSWLCLWLSRMGAEVLGYSLPPETSPSHWQLLKLPIQFEKEDIRHYDRLLKTFQDFNPEIVFHLAAQAFVSRGYESPLETFETNVIGVANVLNACGQCGSVRAAVVVTSDKCYENREWVWGYRENDQLGGYDPYSASKGCAELVANCYRNSFFNPEDFGKKHSLLIATARAGNVIGGGDWGENRLIPDIVRAISSSEKLRIRTPQAVRPWQHVLDAISGYLLLASRLLSGEVRFAEAWNFGPSDSEIFSVGDTVKKIHTVWNSFSYEMDNAPKKFHETRTLKLDSSKARALLPWRPVWNTLTAIEKTCEWYRAFYEKNDVLSNRHIADYVEDAKKNELTRAKK